MATPPESLSPAAAAAVAEEDEGEEARGLLYEAYNELQSLAAELGGAAAPAPAVVVVGHQTDGKSALVEALMGFQFNHVGGGTKTRRPVALHLRFNPRCHVPHCRLVVGGGGSGAGDGEDEEAGVAGRAMPLADIQAYIEAENMRLENDPSQFSEKEIIIRIEYKHCPNLTIIDTPGLILPAPGRKNRVMQSQACAVETLVRAKIKHKETIILCLEDCSDWSNATTRRVVMQVDPDLARTVLVSTKLDTKILQFARASDVEVFLHPPTCVLDGSLLGDSPFFTSVPSGRVGSCHEAVFRSNEEFKKAISLRELEDVASLEDKLGRGLTKEEKNRIGVSNLRLFLEEQLKKRYIESVPLIIPLLEKEHRAATRKLREVAQEISDLDEAKMKEKARLFHDSFLSKLSLLLKGMVVAPPDRFGETLINERINGGTFTGSENFLIPNKLMPNAGMRLYGGAQYHRAMAEFRLVVGSIKCPPITREEIVNACGVEDIHDGTNYSRTACVIAVAKARDTFEPHLHQLGFRLLYIMKRLIPISAFLLEKDGENCSSHNILVKRVQAAFDRFAESTEQSCRERCMEDLVSTTRYVTWSLHNKFNCFLLMPIVDKLPALLREDLESAFEDDLDSIFDVTQLRHSLGQRKRDLETELKRIKRLKEKFAEINKKLNSLQVRHSITSSSILARKPWCHAPLIGHRQDEHGVVDMTGGDNHRRRGGGGGREAFFHCLDRVPSGLHIDADFPSDDDDDDDDDDDVRVSFASAMGDHNFQSFRRHQAAVVLEEDDDDGGEEEAEDMSKYDMWMSDEHVSIQERRRRLHHGLGLASSRDLALRRHSTKKRFVDIPRSMSKIPLLPSPAAAASSSSPAPASCSARDALIRPSPAKIARRRSDGCLAASASPSLRRARSLPARHAGGDDVSLVEKFRNAASAAKSRDVPSVPPPATATTPKSTPAVDKGVGEAGKSQEIAAVAGGGGATTSNTQTGVQLGLEELEKFIGNTPIMKHLMRRGQSGQHHSGQLGSPAAAGATAAPPKSDKPASGKKKGGWLKNIKSAAIGFIHDKDTSNNNTNNKSSPSTTTTGTTTAAASSSSSSSSTSTSTSERLKPACVLEGHQDDVLDLTWSGAGANSGELLLSSSMDKTVRLWDTDAKACLKMFAHNDYVTCIQFNPVDDRFFISGSLDAKVRLWSIPDRQVVDWTDLNEMVTATSYTPDGQGAIIGSHKGSCRFYKTTDCKLSQEAQIDIQTKKRKSQAKKITGFQQEQCIIVDTQFAPGNPSEVLVTSADSQIRVFDGVTMVQKFRGFKNTSSQISAAYTTDGRYVVCASEDSHVYLWRAARAAATAAPAAATAIGGAMGMKAKTWCTTRSYENFYCKDVSAAVPWPLAPSLPSSGDASSPSSASRQKRQGGVSCSDEVCSMPAAKSGELSNAGTPLTHSGQLAAGGGKGGGGADGGNAWGLVVVTASLHGEIRVYQNFGMPFRIRGQGNLFY
uniref:Dynamin-type G domain-containing protein n=1 Tax=Leersia perrieri TaxID=77586 RepID=A0A0D9XXG1_9ORYZ